MDMNTTRMSLSPYKNKKNQILLIQYIFQGQCQASIVSPNITVHHNLIFFKGRKSPNLSKCYAKPVSKSALKVIMLF